MLSRELKIGIFCGVISSVLVIIFVQPILNFMWRVVLSFGEYVQAGYVNSIYRRAALGDMDLFGQIAVYILILLFLIVPGLFAALTLHGKKSNDKFLFVIRFSTMTMALVLSTYLFIIFSLHSGVIHINASFNQRLTVLAPAISESEYKEFKAQWANMRNQNDYKALVVSMEKRAKDLQIQLEVVWTLRTENRDL